MKLKNFAAGAMLAAASFSAFAAAKDLGTLDSSGFDTLLGQSDKLAKAYSFVDFWTFTVDVPSATSFGAQQTFAAPAGAISGFGAELEGFGPAGQFTHSIINGNQQNLSWAGNLAAGEYTVKIWGKSELANTKYSVAVSALPVPEPTTYGMLLGGLALVGAIARRKAKKAA